MSFPCVYSSQMVLGIHVSRQIVSKAAKLSTTWLSASARLDFNSAQTEDRASTLTNVSTGMDTASRSATTMLVHTLVLVILATIWCPMVILACPPILVLQTTVAVTTSVPLPVSPECAVVDLAMSSTPMEHRAISIIHVLWITVVANSSVVCQVILECAVADPAFNYPVMERRVPISMSVLAMEERATVMVLASTLTAHDCASAQLAINCLQMEYLVKVSISFSIIASAIRPSFA